MSEDTPDQPAVSQESFDRIKGQLDAAQGRVAELEGVVKDQAYMEKARSHFTAKGVSDPDWAAEIALPSMKSAGTEVDGIGDYLDSKFTNLYPVESANDGQPPAEPDGDAAPVAAPDAVEPPGFARPSPAGDGTAPEQKVYTIEDPEIQALIEANETAKLQAMEQEGTFRWIHTKVE